MWKFHLPYKGPPEDCENRDYGLLFLLAFAAAVAEWIVAKYLANSTLAMADAIHALVHCTLYLITFLTGVIFKKYSLSKEKKLQTGRVLGVAVYSPIILFGLGYVVWYEAIPRFISPSQVVSQYMVISAVIGLIANLLSWMGLKEIKKQHGVKDTRHSLMTWDALEDILISAAVLIGALAILFTGIQRIDSILTFFAALWIVIGVYKILKKEISEMLSAN